ncbi:MAG: hypothetical protein A2017_03335 [Lentisphaerae bacterium GWF2_44_16]|nr:MAG: hypothetical protein A2017_03335 [Lentisphaerae bacterium GWF2_44_16]
MDKILEQLNPEQREAAKTIKGPVLVLAGAGTGKTRVITYRIAYMLRHGIPPENILGMTFTNKAAREMKERLASLVSENDAAKVTLGTFHSFCARLLRKEIRIMGFTPNFTIADDSDQAGIIKQAQAELGLSKREEIPVERVLWFIGNAKDNLRTPRMAKNAADMDFDVLASAVYERYQQILENQNMLDFDDLLFFVYRMWNENPEILKKYQNIYKYILVDEYQDTNMVQFEMLRMLAGNAMNICAVGDDDQSIYGWRGAKVENIIRFPEHFPNTKLIKLEQNYRSTNKILGSANKIISCNPGRYEKSLWSNQGEGENLKVLQLRGEEEEAAFIADAISEVVSTQDIDYNDIAILYRSNHLSRLIEQSLRKSQIPYKLVGGQEFFKRKEIRDAAAYLKIIVNPKDDQSLLRILGVPSRGLGDKVVESLKVLQRSVFLSFTELLSEKAFLEKLSSKARDAASAFSNCINKYREIFSRPGDLYQNVNDYLLEVGYLNGLLKIYKDRKEAEKRQENVCEFINAIAQYEQRYQGKPYLFEFLESFALLDENDKTEEEENSGNAVILTTVHAAKGLEFPYVFIIGMEHNIFPHERSIKEGSTEEELRLFYVALTRAKNNLTITHSGSRMRYGTPSSQRPSVFLSYLPEENVDKIEQSQFFKPVDKKDLAEGFKNIFNILNEK